MLLDAWRRHWIWVLIPLSIAVFLVFVGTSGFKGADVQHSGGDDYSIYNPAGITPRAGTVECDGRIPLGIYSNSLGTNQWYADSVAGEHVSCAQAQEVAALAAPHTAFGVPGAGPDGWICNPGSCWRGNSQVNWGLSWEPLDEDVQPAPSIEQLPPA